MELEFWPNETIIGHQSFGGARLKFLQPDSINNLPHRLEFEFTRTCHNSTIQQISPPTQILRSQLDQSSNASTMKPYEMLETSNRFLRHQHPEVDLPNSLLLEHLLEDQDLNDNTTPHQSTLLTGLSIDENHAVILSVAGSLSTEIDCSLLATDQSGIPRLYRRPEPSAILRTPIQQLANGPSLNLAGQAVFLARTHDATSFFTYSPPDTNDFFSLQRRLLPELPSSCPSFGFETSYQLKTTDTNNQIHVDSCVGHTINDYLHQFIVLNSKGQLWKASGINGNHASVKQVGLIDHNEPGDISWARCGIYPTNDSLVVALRKSVAIVDHRLAGTCSQIYAASDDHQITDLQRYNNNRSPHLRLINTTSSIMWIDDRKPQVPILTVKHFRSPDLTLSIGFSAEPEWSPRSSFSLSTAGERFDKVLLWSRMNDTASLHQFKSYPAIPPVVLGHGLNVPVVSCKPSNPRTGLIFFRHNVFNNDHQKISLVEMKHDGSIWHQQLNLIDATAEAKAPNESVQQRSSISVLPMEVSSDEIDSNKRAGEIHPLPKLELRLGAICDDFTRIHLDQLTSDEIPESESSSLFSKFLNPLTSLKPQSLDTSTLPENFEILNDVLPSTSNINDPIIDLEPVLKSLLPRSVSFFRDDQTNIIHDDENQIRQKLDRILAEAVEPVEPDENQIRQRLDHILNEAVDSDENQIRQKLDHILTEAVDLSLKIKHLPAKSTDQESTNGPEKERNQSHSIAVDYLIEEWKIGEPTSEYRWTDFCSTANNEMEKDQSLTSPYSSGARSQTRSRFNSSEPYQDLTRSNREPTVDVLRHSESCPGDLQTFQNNREIVTPKSHQGGQHVPNRTHLFNLSSSPDLGFPSSSFNPFNNILLSTSNSQPTPQSIDFHPSPANHLHAFSQLVPGTHAARNSVNNLSKKKRRVGGF